MNDIATDHLDKNATHHGAKANQGTYVIETEQMPHISHSPISRLSAGWQW
jgi:hypothetical protein